MRFEIDADETDDAIEPVAPGTSSNCTPMSSFYPECCQSGNYAC